MPSQQLFTNFVSMDVKIEPSWKEILKDEFELPYFSALTQNVRNEYASARIYPPGALIFAAFEHSTFAFTKVVIVGQDPYHGPGQANGLAFSVNKGISMPPSLLNIFKEIQAETGAPIPPDGDLTRWADQGVLLLNASLTVREHQPKSHAALGWHIFTDAVIKLLSEQRSNLVFMLWGSDAIKKGAQIDRERHLVLTSPHPSPLSAHRGFFGNGHFTAANDYLAAHGLTPIKW